MKMRDERFFTLIVTLDTRGKQLMKEETVKVYKPERGDAVFMRDSDFKTWGVVTWFNPRRKMVGVLALSTEEKARVWDKLTEVPEKETEVRLVNMIWRTADNAWEFYL